MSDERTWVRVGFDGVPYRIVKELIENTIKCLECRDIVDLKESHLKNT